MRATVALCYPCNSTQGRSSLQSQTYRRTVIFARNYFVKRALHMFNGELSAVMGESIRDMKKRGSRKHEVTAIIQTESVA